jgi:hypothetical protein
MREIGNAQFSELCEPRISLEQIDGAARFRDVSTEGPGAGIDDQDSARAAQVERPDDVGTGRGKK